MDRKVKEGGEMECIQLDRINKYSIGLFLNNHKQPLRLLMSALTISAATAVANKALRRVRLLFAVETGNLGINNYSVVQNNHSVVNGPVMGVTRNT